MAMSSRATSYLVAASVAVVISDQQASAQITSLPTASPTLSSCSLFKDFSSHDFTLNGDAVFTNECTLELTSEGPNQSGSAFSSYVFDDKTNYPFEAYYEYDITDTIVNGESVGGSADGIAFLVHIDPSGRQALNDAGGALGIYGQGGIHCAVVVELDTYFGPTNTGPHAPFSSVNYTRAIDIIATDEVGNATRFVEVDVTDVFTMQGKVWIKHFAGNLDVYLAPMSVTERPSSPTVSATIPLPALMLNRDEIFFGFSSSTGGEFDRHEVTYCTFDETNGVTPTESPSSSPSTQPSRPTSSPSTQPTRTPKPTISRTSTPSFFPTTVPTASSVTNKPSGAPITKPPKLTPSPTESPFRVNVIPTEPTSTRCSDSKCGKGGKAGSKSDDDDDSKGGKGGKAGSKFDDDDDSKGGKGGKAGSKFDDDDSKSGKGGKAGKSGKAGSKSDDDSSKGGASKIAKMTSMSSSSSSGNGGKRRTYGRELASKGGKGKGGSSKESPSKFGSKFGYDDDDDSQGRKI